MLGLRLTVEGRPTTAPALIAANHISWCDIPVLGALAPARFLSKAEVGRWPLIGWLAREAGTLFIRRGGGETGTISEQIARRLGAGESILLFPEGTTSDGQYVLPCHGRLLMAAAATDTPVQPVTIRYLRDGCPDPVAPFIGDDTFQGHLVRLLWYPSATVRVVFHPTLTVDDGDTAQILGRRLRAALLEGFPAAGEAPAAGTGIRTAAAPGQSHRPSLPADPQFPDQSRA